MFNDHYSDKEKECLLGELMGSFGQIRREMFDDLNDLWPGLFNGKVRHQRALFRQMVTLAKRNKIPYTIISTPKRDPKWLRTRNKIQEDWSPVKQDVSIQTKVVIKRAPKKPRLQEQMLAILRNELGYAEKRVTRRIAALVSELITENAMIKLENKELRSYKKDSEVTRNDGNSPLMERHYLKAGD